MEDIYSILWIVIAGGITLLSAANSQRKKRAAAQQHGQAQQPVPTSPEHRAANTPNVRIPRPRKNVPETEPTEKPILSETEECTPQQEQSKTETVTAENFDLQRAVIYAEILRPKLEE